MRKFLLFIPFIFACQNVFALQWIKGKVTSIEVTYLPARLVFSMDSGNVACPSGKMLSWQKESWDNNKIVHSTVLAAMLSGKQISFVINDNDSACIGQYLYIHNE